MLLPEQFTEEGQTAQRRIHVSVANLFQSLFQFQARNIRSRELSMIDLSDDSIQLVDSFSRPLLSPTNSADGNYFHGDDHYDDQNLTIDDDTRDAQQTTTTKAPLKDCILMFFASAGCMICVTAVLSNLVYYTDTMGSRSFFIFNLVLYGPMLPITILQTLFDGTFDQWNGSHATYIFRGMFGFTVSFVCLLAVPFLSQQNSQLFYLSMVCLCLGTASAVLHGTLKQMASFIYPNCGRLAASVAAGMQASALPVLSVSVLSHFGDGPSQDGIKLFYGLIAIMLLVCWGCFRSLLHHSQGVSKSMQRRDSYLSLNQLNESHSHSGEMNEIVRNDCVGELGNLIDSVEPESGHDVIPTGDDDSIQILSTWEIWKYSRPACFVVIITVASSMSVASYFNNVQSQYPAHTSFPQVIFYTRLVGDLLGRPATLYSPPKSMKTLTWMACIRLSFVPVFFLYTGATNVIPKNDVGAICGVFTFAFTSGYLVTLSYQIAPSLLSTTGGDDHPLLTSQAGLINVCFSISILLGFALTFVIGSLQ